ncbi:hypothetical protein [Micromonospora narathiwatensis]|nr:hypothetical protein [Micromonospora narathiwatensis]
MTTLARRVVTVIDAILPTRGSKRGLDNVRLAAWPLLVFALTMALTAAFGVARESGCQGFRAFLGSLLLRQGEPPNCRSVAFLVDIPTVILSLTAPFAAIAYLTILRRLESLVPDLQRTGLLPDDADTAAKYQVLRQWLHQLLPRGWKSCVLFAVSAMMTVWLYTRNLESGGIFQALASPAVPEEMLRDHWWADYRQHPVLAVHCILVGTIGVHYALASAWLYALVGRHLLSRSRRKSLAFRVRYVPRWRDRSFGWSPAIALIMLSYASTINFAISMIAVFDMLQTGSFNRTVAGAFATLGVLTDLTLVILTLNDVGKVHQGVRSSVRKSVARGLDKAEASREQRTRQRRPIRNGRSRSHSVATRREVNIILAARDLDSWPALPISNLPLGLLKVAPGVYAIIQLTRTLTGGSS